jgi:hypothetical protein
LSAYRNSFFGLFDENDALCTSISLVIYDDRFAFLGLYICRKDLRGRGLGLKIWQHAIEAAGSRVVGLDGVVAQQPNYMKSGFATLYRDIRFSGALGRHKANYAGDIQVIGDGGKPCTEEIAKKVVAYDNSVFIAQRGEFVRVWLNGNGKTSAIVFNQGKVVGYGTIRTSANGKRIGPLFADDAVIARAILGQLLEVSSELAGENVRVCIDVPEVNRNGLEIAVSFGLSQVFECARMYKGANPESQRYTQCVFGVSTLELG